MGFKVRSGKICVEGEVVELSSACSREFSACAIWVTHSGSSEDIRNALRYLGTIFVQLNAVDYYMTERESEKVYWMGREIEVPEVLKTTDGKNTGMILATDDFEIDEDQLQKEVRDILEELAL